MLLKRMQPYWRNILKNKKIFMGNYYICKIFAMILIVLIVFTGCGQNRIMEKEEKKETVESEMNEEVKKTAQTFRSVYMKEKSELNTLKVKRKIINCLEEKGYAVKDYGCYSEESCDYPVYAKAVANAVKDGEVKQGILICGTGIGISITANKIKGIRAALCSDTFSAHATREHNDANILAMGARVVGEGLALDIVDTFLETEFSNDERHIRRINMIED